MWVVSVSVFREHGVLKYVCLFPEKNGDGFVEEKFATVDRWREEKEGTWLCC